MATPTALIISGRNDELGMAGFTDFERNFMRLKGKGVFLGKSFKRWNTTSLQNSHPSGARVAIICYPRNAIGKKQ
jgi:hypothetical protein